MHTEVFKDFFTIQIGLLEANIEVKARAVEICVSINSTYTEITLENNFAYSIVSFLMNTLNRYQVK